MVHLKNLFLYLFLSLTLIACNKDGSDGADCAQEVDGNSTTECVIANEPIYENPNDEEPSDGTTTGGTTTGGTTTGGTTTGGTTTGGTTTGGTSTGGGTNGSTLPTAAYTFDTNINFVNTTTTQQAKFDKAIEMIKAVVATEEFRSRVLNHTYNGKKTYVDNGGYTNAQIYQMILDGAEKLQSSKNNTMDMEVELYYAATTTVGYTYSNSKRIWVNTKYFETNAVGGVASNLFHEWLHKLGFGHAVSYSTSRDYSVPYAIGRIVSSIGKTL
jgi:hypothetical protein